MKGIRWAVCGKFPARKWVLLSCRLFTCGLASDEWEQESMTGLEDFLGWRCERYNLPLCGDRSPKRGGAYQSFCGSWCALGEQVGSALPHQRHLEITGVFFNFLRKSIKIKLKLTVTKKVTKDIAYSGKNLSSITNYRKITKKPAWSTEHWHAMCKKIII